MVATLENIGPAVLNGGVSTMLAFVLLANSKSYVFITFFKVFFMVVVFGLFQVILNMYRMEMQNVTQEKEKLAEQGELARADR